MAPLRLAHPRDLAAWREDGIFFSTTSDEAARMYDVLLYQMYSHTEDDRYGGMAQTTERLFEADPSFIMAHVMKHLEKPYQVGWKQRQDLVPETRDFVARALTLNLTDLEQRHLRGLEQVVRGHSKQASNLWLDILSLYPKDLLAMRLVFEYGLCFGDSLRMRAAFVTCRPHYKPHDPYYSFVLSRLAFSVEESGDCVLARKLATKALESNPKDTWGIHAMAHIFDSSGGGREAVQFMQRTVRDWEDASMFACHNFWHTALMHVDVGDFDAALSVYDSEILPRLRSSKDMFPLSDASSFLFRLQMEGRTIPNEQWRELAEIGLFCRATERRLIGYYDGVMAQCFANVACDSTSPHLARLHQELCEEISGYAFNQTKDEDFAKVHASVGLKLVTAAQKFVSGDYAGTASLLYPSRYDIVKLGGSHAQRDVFQQMLCRSLMNSDQELDWRRCQSLLEERKLARGACGVTQRLQADLAKHVANSK